MKITALAVALGVVGMVVVARGGEPGFERHQLTKDFYSEGAAIGDLNRDGKMDVVSGPFWYEGPDFSVKHKYGPGDAVNPLKYSDYFFSWVYDINKDGWPDIVVTGFPGKDTSWFENPKGGDNEWAKHVIIAKTDNESPNFVDVDGDGVPEVVCMNGGMLGYCKPASEDVTKLWEFHAVTPKVGFGQFTHGLGIGDVNGDGKVDFIEHSGWWEQPADGKGLWVKHDADFGPGGAQMYAYDVNGDGLNDVITSLEAHGYGLAWFEQVKEGDKVSFKKHLIVGRSESDNPFGVKITQMHGVALADMNGDGVMDIVTGKRYWAHGPSHDAEPGAPAVLYWFELQREKGKEPQFIPHKIDDDSGVGTQCTVGDVNGDGKMDVVIGNKKGTFVFVQK